MEGAVVSGAREEGGGEEELGTEEEANQSVVYLKVDTDDKAVVMRILNL